jgi:hypothetical protein
MADARIWKVHLQRWSGQSVREEVRMAVIGSDPDR